MKMHISILIFIVLVFCDCSHKAILKKSYVLKEGSKREISLNFISDSVCVIKNIFTDDKNESKQVDYKCRYSVLPDYLILTNSGDFIDTAEVGFFYFPYNYNDSFNIKQERVTVPNYSQGDYKYLKVPYVETDTLIRHKKNILWIKKDKHNKVVGYFKFKSN